jgi:hypothetical protein
MIASNETQEREPVAQTFNPDEAQLKEALKHLAFDVYHYHCYSKLHHEGRLTCPPVLSQAVIYALLLHLRLLLDFFYKTPKRDDIGVDHFRVFPEFDAAFPSRILDPDPNDVRQVSFSLNKRLAHFTATRWTETQKPMQFYDKYFTSIDKLLVMFEAALPDGPRQIFVNTVRDWERKHPAI